MNGVTRARTKQTILMHDFSYANPDDMKSDVLRNGIAPYKKNEKEIEEMCQIVERINKMVIEDAMEKTAIEALKLNLPIE